MHGLTIWTTAVFIIGDIAGGGVLALPRAVEDTGWIGFVLIVVFTLLSTYTAALIGNCWVIIQKRYPEYQSHVPDPYPIMGEKTYGKTGRHLVTLTMNMYNFGSSVVYMVLAAGNIETLLTDVTKDISFCYWLMILTFILVPIICLGTPKDFWPIGVGATFSTAIACIFIVIQALKDNSHSKGTTVHSDVGIQKFSSAFGTMVFAVSGHSVFPTIITDMEKKEDFKIAALLGYGTFTWKRCIVRPLIVLVVLFIAESVPHFGSILSLVGGSTTTLLSYVSPCLFYMKLCKSSGNKTVDPSSSSHRVEFSAQNDGDDTVEIVNDETPLLKNRPITASDEGKKAENDLLASSSKQNVQAKFDLQPSSELILIPLWQKVLNIEIICIGIIGGLAATVSAILTIATPDSLSVPCYVSLNGAGS